MPSKLSASFQAAQGDGGHRDRLGQVCQHRLRAGRGVRGFAAQVADQPTEQVGQRGGPKLARPGRRILPGAGTPEPSDLGVHSMVPGAASAARSPVSAAVPAGTWLRLLRAGISVIASMTTAEAAA